MKPIIPKTPEVPTLSNEEIEFLTYVTFGEKVSPEKSDILFLFSGTHPGHWEKSIEAYKKGYIQKIIVTGGKSLTGIPHSDWNYEDATESEVITQHLLDAGVPRQCIFSENKSTNSLENVIYAKEIYNFDDVNNILVVCKSHAAGRQIRTLIKHLPKHIRYIPFTFDTYYGDVIVSRDNWMNSAEGMSRVWGEYLRILHYGEKGDILKLELENE
ncbi:YdcF family protein [Macrococcoides bohemicum]|uniref:YdcF family protein n=1 Tax=Macrococcoides bohemicum TaxID=1903056 RepID=UPI0028A5E6E8|nr:YdcF family protein [Macrococcus bohemicus]